MWKKSTPRGVRGKKKGEKHSFSQLCLPQIRRFLMAILTISRQIGSVDKEITQSMADLWNY
jgi:hypothetical protein